MSLKNKYVLIVTKAGGGEAASLGQTIVQWLAKKNVRAEIVPYPEPPARVDVQRFRDGCGLVVVLGGDGTYISTAGQVLDWGVPVLGVNHGRVGFLAEAPREDWKIAMKQYLAGELQISRRVAFSYEIQHEDKLIAKGISVNDLVISRGAVARIISFDVGWQGQWIKNIRADGLIVSTPTGSTAYNVSAGGPLIHPEVEVFCLTPVCPFLNSVRPMVLPVTDPLIIEISEASGDVYMTEDGRVPYPLSKGYRVIVQRSKRDLLLARIKDNTFFEKLRSKGFISE